jgi:glycosidase
LKKLIELRKQHSAFAGGELEIIPTENEHILGFMRTHAGNRAVVFANFSENAQKIHPRIFEQYSVHSKHQLPGISRIFPQSEITIEPLDLLIFG